MCSYFNFSEALNFLVELEGNGGEERLILKTSGMKIGGW